MMKNLTCVIASNKMSPVSLQRVVRKHKVWHSNNHFNNISCTNFLIFFLFVCLWFFVPLENFSLIWRRHHSLLQIFTYAMHLSSEGHPFIMIISEDSWHSHQLPSVWQWGCHYLFLRVESVAAGIRTPSLPYAGLTL